MKKYKLSILLFFAGLALLLYSWYISYPLSIDFPGDSIFNHISPLYWLSLSLVLGSLYVLGVFSKSRFLKIVVSVAIIVAIFSLYYFYFSMPTSDSQYFRGVTEYFMKTRSLDASQLNHVYFQWPSYFLLADIVTSVSGLSLIDFEFLFFAIIGVLLAVSLYVYASKLFKDGALLAVVAFFVSMFFTLNYQSAPFSFALALTFVLFMLETQKKSTPVLVSMFVIFFCISFTHFFVAWFFILYLIFRALISKSKQYAKLSLLTLAIYSVTQITFVSWNYLETNLRFLLTISSDYSSMIKVTVTPNSPAVIPFNMVAQNISRAVIITTILICCLGFLVLMIKRKLRAIDGAIFLSGLTYSALGVVFNSLGIRAICIFFIPVSLGAAYLFETRFRSYLKVIFLVLLVLFVFVPIHNSYNTFYDSFVPFQTNDTYNAAQFLLEYYDWTQPSLILAHSPVSVYLISSLDTKKINATFEDDFSPVYPTGLNEYDSMLYTVGLDNSFIKYNFTVDGIANKENLNIIYNNGFSAILIKGSSFTLAPN